MKHLTDLNRSRAFKLYNFLPEEIAKNEPPVFFIPSHNIDPNIRPLTTEKVQTFLHDKIKAKFKKVGHATTAMTKISQI